MAISTRRGEVALFLFREGAGPNDTTGRVDLNTGPAIPALAAVEAPRIGRPHRGDRGKTKAARRARRRSR